VTGTGRGLRQAIGSRAHSVVGAALGEQVVPMLRRAARSRRQDRALLSEVRDRLVALEADLSVVRQIVGHQFDGVHELRQQLVAVRRTDAYARAFADEDPLVTVRIATYDRGDELFERALPSVLAQTHRNLEVILVGDGSGPETERRAAAIRDSRFRFVNQPHRGVYPVDAKQRWMVAGAPAMNRGAELAEGTWIAPLDDDDEFTPDHVEELVQHARTGRFEMCHGQLRAHLRGVEPWALGAQPPEKGLFGFQAAIYLRLIGFFEYDPSSWVLDEPADWNLCRRMIEAGVRIGHLPRVVTELYPTGARTDEGRCGETDPALPS
jgi:hypothetical protein